MYDNRQSVDIELQKAKTLFGKKVTYAYTNM